MNSAHQLALQLRNLSTNVAEPYASQLGQIANALSSLTPNPLLQSTIDLLNGLTPLPENLGPSAYAQGYNQCLKQVKEALAFLSTLR